MTGQGGANCQWHRGEVSESVSQQLYYYQILLIHDSSADYITKTRGEQNFQWTIDQAKKSTFIKVVYIYIKLLKVSNTIAYIQTIHGTINYFFYDILIKLTKDKVVVTEVNAKYAIRAFIHFIHMF